MFDRLSYIFDTLYLILINILRMQYSVNFFTLLLERLRRKIKNPIYFILFLRENKIFRK